MHISHASKFGTNYSQGWAAVTLRKMRQLTILVFLLSPLATMGQSSDSETRIIKGLIWDKASNSTAIGSSVIQYKTRNGTVIQADGMFELEVPKRDTVLVQIPFCFESYYVLYLPTDDFKKI